MQEGFPECYHVRVLQWGLKWHDGSTFSRSRGCVQAAATAEAIPPRYHLWTTGLGAFSSRIRAGFIATVACAMLDMLLHLHAPHSAAMSACFIAFLPLYLYYIQGSNTSQSARVSCRAEASRARSHDFLRAPTCYARWWPLDVLGCFSSRRMAEVVHRNLELMLPELEELERSGIFSPDEIKWVLVGIIQSYTNRGLVLQGNCETKTKYGVQAAEEARAEGRLSSSNKCE